MNYVQGNPEFERPHREHKNFTAETNKCLKCGDWRGAYGLEKSVEDYVQHSIEILREIRRVLRPDGCCFFNLGDSYSGSNKGVYADGHGVGGPKQQTVRGSVGLPVCDQYGGQNGKHGRELSDSSVRDFFLQNPCGECVKILLNRNHGNGDYPDLGLALLTALSNHSHKGLPPDHSENSDLTSPDGHNVTETLGLCFFANLLAVASPAFRVSNVHASFGEFPRCPSSRACWDFPFLSETIWRGMKGPKDSSLCPFWIYLISHGIQGLRESISNTLEIDDSSVVRIRDMVYDFAESYSILPYHHNNLKPKDLCLIPFRVALAAQADGWWVRSDIAWVKGNPMPESCTDRPTDTWEHVFMFTKSARYFFDMEAVKEISTTFDREVERQPHCFGGNKSKVLREQGIRTQGAEYTPVSGRHLRNVWNINTQGFPGSHFATFPERLPEICIKAATSEAGVCPKCGEQYERIVDTKYQPVIYPGGKETPVGEPRYRGGAKSDGNDPQNWEFGRARKITNTLGWRAACTCNAGPAIPATVLDPFCGSGTTLAVATRLGRRSIGYEISEPYLELIIDRNRQQALMPKLEGR